MNSPFVQPIWSSAAAEKVLEVPRRAGGYHHAFNESLEATPPGLLAGNRGIETLHVGSNCLAAANNKITRDIMVPRNVVEHLLLKCE